jgi:hypothetical protein
MLPYFSLLDFYLLLSAQSPHNETFLVIENEHQNTTPEEL